MSGKFISKPPPQRPERSFGLDASAGRIPGVSVVHKFGFSGTIGTSFAPLTPLNDYQMPLAAAGTALRVKAGGNAADDVAGAGARGVTMEGLSSVDGSFISETVDTAGALASSATTALFMRGFRAYPSGSGTHADGFTTFSQAAAITIENSAGGTDWMQIGAALGQTQIAAYSVPLGKNAFVERLLFNVSSNKAVSFKFMQRRDILAASAPFAPWRLIEQMDEITGETEVGLSAPLGPFPALTDLMIFAKVEAGTGSASVDLEILLEDA